MTTIETKLIRAAALKAKMAELAPAVTAFKEAELDLKLVKQELLDELTKSRSRGTDYVAGLRATKASKTSFVVKSEATLLGWMEDNLEDAKPYLRVNTASVQTLAKQYQEKTSNVLPGGEFETTDYLRLEEAKPNVADL